MQNLLNPTASILLAPDTVDVQQKDQAEQHKQQAAGIRDSAKYCRDLMNAKKSDDRNAAYLADLAKFIGKWEAPEAQTIQAQAEALPGILRRIIERNSMNDRLAELAANVEAASKSKQQVGEVTDELGNGTGITVVAYRYVSSLFGLAATRSAQIKEVAKSIIKG